MKQIKKIILYLSVFLVITPIAINLIMFLPFSITPADLGNTHWLSFWGNYVGGSIGGIGTLLTVYFTIQYYEKQNKENKMNFLNTEKISRINYMLDKINKREAIPSSYYKYDNIFKESESRIETYNKLLTTLVAFFSDRAMGTMINLLFVRDENDEYLENHLSNYFKIPQEIKEYTITITKYSLYENASELIKSDPVFAHMIHKEGGGSYSLWYSEIHEFYHEEYMKQYLDEFFILIPQLITELNSIKNQLLETSTFA